MQQSPAIIRATLFAVGLLSFLAFACLLFASTSAYLLSGEYGSGRDRMTLGVGPFVAGSSSSKSTEVVYWSELTGENSCDPTSDIYAKWSVPNNLCYKGQFMMPASVVALQVMSSIAIALSFLSCTIAFSSQRQTAVKVVAMSSFIAMISSCTHFALWTTLPMSVNLQGSLGAIIPLWDASATGKIIPSIPVRMSFGTSFALFVLSFILLFFSATLSFSIARLPSRFYSVDLYDEDDGMYGQMGKL